MSNQVETDFLEIAVCGLHMQGFPLSNQLTELGGKYFETTQTAASYRLYALETLPKKPGLIKVLQKGQPIELEVWKLPKSSFGDFLQKIPSPLGLGKVQLQDDREVIGFICEPYAIKNAEDITDFGGWRNFSANRSR